MEFDIDTIKAAAAKLQLPSKEIDKLLAVLIGDAEGEDSLEEEVVEEEEKEVVDKPTFSFYALVSYDPDNLTAEQVKDLAIKFVKYREDEPSSQIIPLIDEAASIYNSTPKGQKSPLESRFEALESCTKKQFGEDSFFSVQQKNKIIETIPMLNNFES